MLNLAYKKARPDKVNVTEIRKRRNENFRLNTINKLNEITNGSAKTKQKDCGSNP